MKEKYEGFKMPEEFQTDLWDVKPKEARKFFEWYMSIKDERVAYLDSQYFKDTGKHLDYTTQSLYDLIIWLAPKMELNETGEEYYREVKVWHHVSQEYFTLESNFILMDAGMYFNEVILKLIPEYTLGVVTRFKTSFARNQPYVINPNNKKVPEITSGVHVLRVSGSRIYDKEPVEKVAMDLKKVPERLLELYLGFKEQERQEEEERRMKENK